MKLQEKSVDARSFVWQGLIIISVMAFFITATALGSYVRIPLGFTPVPVTLQTFFVLLCGMFMGRNWGALTQALFVMLGALGLPLFANGASGIAYVAGSTGGYLIGFIAAAYCVGYISSLEKLPRLVRYSIAGLAGFAIYFTAGMLYLTYVLHISIAQAYVLGVAPFIVGDLLKVALAALIASACADRVRSSLKR